MLDYGPSGVTYLNPKDDPKKEQVGLLNIHVVPEQASVFLVIIAVTGGI